jgi:CPA2 family monovalent cation:H+ antiporter-2
MEGFLYQTTIYLAAAVIAVPIAARLGLGSVLGYLAAGIVIGPVLGLIGHESHDLQHFAEFGVVMMLFLIGLELEPRALWDMRHRLLGLGGLQIGLTTLAIFLVFQLLGYTWTVSLAVGMILALSSTAIVLQTLSEKGLIQTPGGRSAFSVLLTQDIAVIPMLAFLPLLALPTIGMTANPDGSLARTALEEASGHSMSLVDGLPGWGVTLVTLGAVAAVVLTGIYLTAPVFRFIHAAKLREMYTALALVIVVGIAFLMNMVGLSPALGTFLAGVVLANSEFRHELESDIEPFKGLLLGLFFITVGAGIDFKVLFGDPVMILAMAFGIILVKGFLLFVIGRAFGLRRRRLILFTLSLSQAGEFGFVLLSFSQQQNVLPPILAEQLLLVIALTMLITPALFLLYDWLSKKLGDPVAEEQEADAIDDEGPVIIAGIGRFGQIVNRLAQNSGVRTVVLDHDMKTIEVMRRFGFKGYFGDPTRPDILRAAGLDKARVLVAAMDNPAAVTRLVHYARKFRPDIHIIARARDRRHTYELYQAGADDIVRETFDSSLRAGRYVLENTGFTDFEAAKLEAAFYHHDRETIRELAELWDPKIPADQNPEYVARSKELERDLEAALQALLLEKEDAA